MLDVCIGLKADQIISTYSLQYYNTSRVSEETNDSQERFECIASSMCYHRHRFTSVLSTKFEFHPIVVLKLYFRQTFHQCNEVKLLLLASQGASIDSVYRQSEYSFPMSAFAIGNDAVVEKILTNSHQTARDHLILFCYSQLKQPVETNQSLKFLPTFRTRQHLFSFRNSYLSPTEAEAVIQSRTA